jgi:hypothetical protein
MTRLPFKDPRFPRAAGFVAFPLVAALPTLGTTGPLLGLMMGLTPLTMIVVVVCPAVWSRKKSRRDAALAVLDRLYRRRKER